MTKEELWGVYCSKNPSFKNPDAKITLTSRGLKKLFDQTWEMAQKKNEKEFNFEDFLRGFNK